MMTTRRKMIVWVTQKDDDETKDEVLERLYSVMQGSNVDIEAEIFATDKKECEVSFQMSGSGIQGVLDVIDAT